MKLIVQFCNTKTVTFQSAENRTTILLPKNNKSDIGKEIIGELTNSLKKGIFHHVEFCTL